MKRNALPKSASRRRRTPRRRLTFDPRRKRASSTPRRIRLQRWVLGALAVLAFSCWMSAGEEDGSFWPLDLITPKKQTIDSEHIKVLDVAGGNVVKEMPLEEYIVCVVSAEMPVSYEPEALKAQAVAARTYTYDKMLGGQCDRSEAVICSDSGHCQAYCDEQGRRKKWGRAFEQNEAKLRQAVEQTKGQVLEYDGAPIVALFHSTSGGRTEDVENVYKNALPYLRGVDSPGEETAPRYQRTVTVSKEEFVQKIMDTDPSAGIDEKNVDASIGAFERTASDRVQSVMIGKAKLTGKQIRALFTLDSTDFSFAFDATNVLITTKGYGHGVGMSQVGANAMALAGKTYEEILTHYYTGVTLAQMEKP